MYSNVSSNGRACVVGAGFGDEGKGLFTSYLCSQVKDPVVVRFNGGHQAGHTVVVDNHRHVFTNFGSGTLQGAPTYWSQFCTVDPGGIVTEHEYLKQFNPRLIVHPLCPVVTPYDIKFNRQAEEVSRKGSVGLGFGATIQRQEAYFKLYVQDLYYPKVFHHKLWQVHNYYGEMKLSHEDLGRFFEDVEQMKKIIELQNEEFFRGIEHRLVFEGAQGIMLDMDYGFFPNVTRSNTTSKNAISLVPEIKDIYYITRCYQTRHGVGFMSNEDKKVTLKNNENETNKSHPWQGEFRIGELDIEQLKYALMCDANHSGNRNKNLVITCCDQLEGVDPMKITSSLNVDFGRVFISNGPTYKDIQQIA